MDFTPSDIVRFWSKVDRSADNCWPWKVSTRAGYGQFGLAGKTPRAHRVAYELWVGPIPAGKTLDHLCHTADTSCPGGATCPHRRCCRPEHLEPIERGANVLLGRGIQAINALRAECIHGHPFTPENTRVRRPTKSLPNGGRSCRTCDRALEARRPDRRDYYKQLDARRRDLRIAERAAWREGLNVAHSVPSRGP